MDISTTPGARPSLASAAMEISPRRSRGVMTPIREDEERATPSTQAETPRAPEIAAALRPGAGFGAETDCMYMPAYVSIPPQPDPELLLDSLRLERDPTISVEPRPGLIVDQQMVLAEHGSEHAGPALAFRLYRERATWQMIKRRWFSALTEFNVQELFQKCAPEFFLRVLQMIYEAWDTEVYEFGPVDDPHSLHGLVRSGAVQLIFKGGNAVALIKGIARSLLPEEVQKTLHRLAPTDLSDLDFLAFINYVKEPWLADEANYATIHTQVRTAAVRALERVVNRIEAGVKAGDPCFANFQGVFQHQDRAALSAKLSSVLRSATEKLQAEVRSTTEDHGFAAEDLAGVHRLLDTFTLKEEATVLPGQRESIAIHNEDENNRVKISFHGESRHLYVSDNPDICFKDIRCVSHLDACNFSLVRALVGFNVECAADVGVSAELHDEVKVDFHRFTKGEGIDVSIPRRNDIAHSRSLVDWKDDERVRARQASLRAPGVNAQFPMESIEALIHEQRDLSFGRRMQSVLIWRIAKVTKRLSRLLELCGIKTMTLPFSWARKAKAFTHLKQRLERFAAVTLPRLYEGLGQEADGPKDQTPPQKRRRQTLGAAVQPVAQLSAKPRPWTETKHAPGEDIDEVLDAATINDMLLASLDDLALKVFSNARKKDLPSNFVARWQETLQPMVSLAADFATAFEQLRDLHASGHAPQAYSEESFYSFNFDETWAGLLETPREPLPADGA
jgi:hypothetical protein